MSLLHCFGIAKGCSWIRGEVETETLTMPTMRELSRWIRDYGREPRQMERLFADRFVWHQLWTAMDIIDDVDSAMTAYIENEFPTDNGERYLRVYGAMQGLFLQQDALRDLIKAIHPTKDIPVNDVLKDIREARNASVGHPTQMKRKGVLSAHGIVQCSMRKSGFELLSYPVVLAQDVGLHPCWRN